jgi:glycosyltransferase involved in cell wall biosynthesis
MALRLLLIHPGASFSTADVYNGYVTALRAIGVECIEYRLDSRIDAWGQFIKHQYRGRKLGPGDDAEILHRAGMDILAQAIWHNVDGVLAISAMYLRLSALMLLRMAGIPCAVMLTESPYDDEQQAQYGRLADVVFTNERTSVPYLSRFCRTVKYLPHAYDPAKHRPDLPLDESVPAHDVVFVGTGFRERRDLLAAVDWTGIDLGLYGQWDRPGKLKPYVRGKVVPNEMAAQLYRKAKIGLNLYRTSKGWDGHDHITHAESLNPRAVELAACGVFTISDYREEVREVFGQIVPTFRDARELGRHIRVLLSDALDPQLRVTRECLPNLVAHLTFEARAHDVVTTLQDVGWASRSVAQAAD